MSEIYSIGRTSDSKSVVEFVKDIELRPCLYNTKSHEYVNQDLKRKTWASIASKWNCSVAECKEKWRKIRTAYSRSLKPKYRNNKLIPTKPYYLASYLKFIKPKVVPAKNNTVKVENGSDDDTLINSDDISNPHDDAVDMLKEDFFSEDDDGYFVEETLDSYESISHEVKEPEINNKVNNKLGTDYISIVDNIETIQHEVKTTNKTKELKLRNNSVPQGYTEETVNNNVNKTKEVQQGNIRNNHNCEMIVQRCSYCTNIESKPRKMLLFSLLPDIEALTDQQMRVFRRGLIDLIDRCKYEMNDG